MGKAMKLEKLMGQMQKRSFSTSSSRPGDSSVEDIMGKISGVLSEDLVKKTNSVFSFSLTDTKTEYFLDLKNGYDDIDSKDDDDDVNDDNDDDVGLGRAVQAARPPPLTPH